MSTVVGPMADEPYAGAGGTAARNAVAVDRLERLYAVMARNRAFETAAGAAYAAGEVPGFVHLSIGQEAVAAGVCANLEPHDLLTSTHRGHGHAIAKGADTAAMMAEIFGKATGLCGGKGGSMHVADFRVGMLGANGVVAAGLPIAVGAAQGLRLLGRPGLVAAFFGDGAMNRGPFFESLNWAAVYRLPVLFVCEDNGFAATTRTGGVSAGPGGEARAESLGVPATMVDGDDVEAVDAAAARLCAAIRTDGGPRFLIARTYRLSGHIAHDPGHYRPAEEVTARWATEPLTRARARLIALGVTESTIAAMDEAATAEIAATLEAARAAPAPEPHAAYTDVADAATLGLRTSLGGGAWR